jgi:hypothetical protein
MRGTLTAVLAVLLLAGCGGEPEASEAELDQAKWDALAVMIEGPRRDANRVCWALNSGPESARAGAAAVLIAPGSGLSELQTEYVLGAVAYAVCKGDRFAPP